MQEVILFYNGLRIRTRQILYSRGEIPSKTAADVKIAIQEMAEYSQKWHNGTSRSRSTETSDGLAVIQAQLNNLGRKIKKVNEKVYAAQVGYEQCKGPYYTKDFPLKEEGKTLEEAYYTHFDRTVKYPKGIAKNVVVGIGNFTFLVDFIILDIPEDIKVPLILRRPFLSTARAKINVYKRKITLRVEEERIVFTSFKPASSLIKMVYMLSLRERMELDLEYRLMGETLVLKRSLNPFLEDYIELNDLNKPFELRRNQSDNLMPTIEESELIEEFSTRDDELNIGINDYPRALMNVPIFVGTFSVVTDFTVLEDMDAYRDEGMGDVIFGKPFLREVGIKARRFEGIITIYNGDDEVTYQMVRSHPRFKHHTNEQCNKIPPLLKVSENDEKNEISHAYQNLKGFYKEVLNLRPDYIRDEKTEEWLTRGHISVHEME
ncbi:homeodomain-like protein [Tanacetum coccineum]